MSGTGALGMAGGALKIPRGWQPSETHMDILDDYMWNRGHYAGTPEEGDRALQLHAPELNKAQRTKAIKQWTKEMKEAEPGWGKDEEQRNSLISKFSVRELGVLIHVGAHLELDATQYTARDIQVLVSAVRVSGKSSLKLLNTNDLPFDTLRMFAADAPGRITLA